MVKTTNDERRPTNDERRTTNDERQNDERRTTNDERRTTNDERRTTNDQTIKPSNDRTTLREATSNFVIDGMSDACRQGCLLWMLR